MKKAVAITGGTGRVGVHVARHLLRAHYRVHALVRSGSQPLAGHPLLHEDATLTEMNLATLPEREILDWLSTTRPLALIHAAALTDVAACEREPSLACLINTYTTRMLARACASHGIHFLLLSADSVFDGIAHPGGLYRECEQVNPQSQYGRSKAQAELATQEECAGKTAWTICRTSLVYGTMQWRRPDFTQWVRTTLQRNETLAVAEDQVSSPTCAVDLARILVAVVEQRLEGLYHIAGSTPISHYHFALKIAQHYGFNQALIQPVQTPESGPRCRRSFNTSLCVDKITNASGIRPLSLDEGLSASKKLLWRGNDCCTVSVPEQRTHANSLQSAAGVR